MTDLFRHSKGYWRSIYIFTEAWFPIRGEIEEEIKKLRYEYSYCHYGKVESSVPGKSEEAHITFRVNFPDTKAINNFERFLKKKKYKYESHNYDEPLWVKKAYVIGTKMANAIKEVTSSDGLLLDDNFFRLMFHGMFNDLHYDYADEAAKYLMAFTELFRLISAKKDK